MSCRSFRQILAVLGDEEPAMWAVLERAVDLAEVQRARLTLAKTTDPGPVIKWFGPPALLAAGAGAGVTESELQAVAADKLARASEFVPESVSLTTVLLGTDTACALHRLAKDDTYDLLVIDIALADHSHRLRREIKRLQLCTLTVLPQPSQSDRPGPREPGPRLDSAPIASPEGTTHQPRTGD